LLVYLRNHSTPHLGYLVGKVHLMIETGRVTLAELLSEIDYPATRDDLVLLASRRGIAAGTVAALQGLSNRSFNGTWDVRMALEGDLAAAG
jgi:hypothetical protein